MRTLILALLMWIASAPTQATSLIAQGSIEHSGNVLSTVPFDDAVVGTQVAGFTMRLLTSESTVLAGLFSDLVLKADDVGKTFSVSAGSPELTAFSAVITDGLPHRFLREFWLGGFAAGAGGGGAVNDTEIDGFNLTRPAVTGPDLAGLVVERIDFRLDELAIAWSDPHSVATTFAATYSVYGQPVPEASTTLLAGSGLLVLGLYCRIHRSRRERTGNP